MEWSWWVFLCIPVAWLMENLVHECSHLLAAKITVKAKLVYMWVLPRWINIDTEESKRWWPWHFWKKPWPGKTRFVFARVVWKKQSDSPCPRVIHFSPNYGAALIFIVASLLFIFSPPEYRVCILPWMICPLVDVGTWWRGFFWGSEFSDGKRWRARKDF